MRQTKRRRTRDAACQTLTYRELWDHAKATGPMHNTGATGGKNCDNNLSPPPRAVHQVHPRQRQQARHHVVPASRYVSMLNPPSSPVPSTTTLSASSVYRTTDGGGIVHGAIVRGGTRGGDAQGIRPWPQQQQERLAGRVGDAGGDSLRHQRDEAQHPSSSKNGVERGGSLARPTDRQGTLCSPPPSLPQQISLHSSARWQKETELDTSTASSARLTETPGTQRASPPLGQVSVSWNQEQEQGVKGVGEGAAPFTAVRETEMGVPKNSRSGRRPESLPRKGGVWSTRSHTVVSEKGSGNRSHADGGGSLYEPLSKGPDYRKVFCGSFGVFSSMTNSHEGH